MFFCITQHNANPQIVFIQMNNIHQYRRQVLCKVSDPLYLAKALSNIAFGKDTSTKKILTESLLSFSTNSTSQVASVKCYLSSTQQRLCQMPSAEPTQEDSMLTF